MTPQEMRVTLAAARCYGRRLACTGKRVHGTERAARQVAVVDTMRHDSPLEHYPCPWCGWWHVGRALTERERWQLERLVAEEGVIIYAAERPPQCVCLWRTYGDGWWRLDVSRSCPDHVGPGLMDNRTT